MANNKKKPVKNKNQKGLSDKEMSELNMLDKTAKNILSILDNSYNDKEILNAKDQKFRSILNRELEISKGVSQGSVVDFVASMKVNKTVDPKNKLGNSQNNSPNTNEMFTQNINDIFGYFQDLYRNRFIEISDLKFIAKFIPALGEAVKTVLDSVVSSDNIAETINRSIELPQSVGEEDQIAIREEIERAEKDLDLLKKLKNIVYKKTLVVGTHYVYAVSYNKIFEEYDMIKKSETTGAALKPGDQFNSKRANESMFSLGDVDITSAMESVGSILSNSTSITSNKKLTTLEVNNIINNCMEDLPIINCDQSSIYFEAMESVASCYESEYAMKALEKANSKNKYGLDFNNKLEQNILDLQTPDGTKEVNARKNYKAGKFNINGTYIKYIDAKNIIPLKVFDQKIGYYLIHPKIKKNKNSSGQVSGINSIGSTLFSAVDVGETKKFDAIQRIVTAISEGIMQNFDSKFVTKNAEFKKLIADCIIANGLTDTDYNIQFIPAEDIIEFTVNETEEGFGESILTDSLFPAKLLLSMIVCRMLNYINKTGNKTIAHIYKGPVNAMTSNQINRVIRDLQEQNVTFNDLLSPNLVFNKFNRDGNIALPRAKNGDRLVEFEQQDGQQIDMSPEYEKELENMAILGTGVPSVIMEYAGSADFAKQLVSANIKFAGRVASLQSDLENATTLLYKKICENSVLTDELKTIALQSLEIKLPRPRVLTNSNNNDYVQSIVQTAEAIAEVVLGRDSISDTEKNPNGVQLKERLMYEITKKSAPFVDWDEINTIKEKLNMELSAEDKQKDDSSSF